MKHNTIDLAHLPCRQYKNGAWRTFEDDAAAEHRVTLRFEDGGSKNLWAFPACLTDLALGHPLLDMPRQGLLPEATPVDGYVFDIRYVPGELPAAKPWDGQLSAEDILTGAASFMAMAGHWDATGCFHRAAVYDPSVRNFAHHVEDIGRHNCLDRLAGWALAKGRPLGGMVLFVSARATASLVGKAVRSGYAVMVSRSAVTTAGVEAAREAGMTLVGFSRENRFSIFTDPHERIDARS